MMLVTGGAGFIGSGLVRGLLEQGQQVRVLDDLSSGAEANLPAGVELIAGDIADEGTVAKAVDGADVVFHLAAHRAVQRSVDQPLTTDTANVHGTLTVLDAAHRAGVRRVVAASSSSVYGGAAEMPTAESAPLVPRSPYAVSKLAGEHYCRVFSELYGLETVSLRFFNVYGPRQSPQSMYAAVIPLFGNALLRGEPPMIFGDGLQSRDFTYVDDAVAAAIAAAHAPAAACSGKAYNVAGGAAYSLLEVLEKLSRLVGVEPAPVHGDPRPGDVRHTRASIDAARTDLGHQPLVDIDEGLRRTVGWLRETP